jgi:dTDP-4-dehydrorhamnose 3,5-epimerase
MGWEIHRSNPGGEDLPMIFTETKLPGAYLIQIERHEDERGFFARTWCQHEFEENGLNPSLVQCNLSHNARKGTLRGMHYQDVPYQEAKLVSCIRGAIYDVIIDIRPGSPSFGAHLGAILTAQTHEMLYVPEGFAHGFLTLEDETQVFYQMSEFYAPDYARGFRWNDPTFNVQWPAEVRVISTRDASYPDFLMKGEG